MGQREDVGQDREAMHTPPSPGADSPAPVEAQPQDRREPAGDYAEPCVQRAVGERERHRDPDEPRTQVRVEQEQASVGDDQAQGHQGRGFVEVPELCGHARPAHEAAGHREAHGDRDAERQHRDDPERAAGEPEDLMGWIDHVGSGVTRDDRGGERRWDTGRATGRDHPRRARCRGDHARRVPGRGREADRGHVCGTLVKRRDVHRRERQRRGDHRGDREAEHRAIQRSPAAAWRRGWS